MGRRELGSEDVDLLPAIDVDASGGDERRSLLRASRSATVVVVDPPFADLARRGRGRISPAPPRHGAVIGNHPASDPPPPPPGAHPSPRPAPPAARVPPPTPHHP